MPDNLSTTLKEDALAKSNNKKSVRFDENTNNNNNNNNKNDNNNCGNKKSDLNETNDDYNDKNNEELYINLIDNSKNLSNLGNKTIVEQKKNSLNVMNPMETTRDQRGLVRNFLKFFRHLRKRNSLNGEYLSENNLKISTSTTSIDSSLSNSSKNHKCCICKCNKAKKKRMRETEKFNHESMQKQEIKQENLSNESDTNKKIKKKFENFNMLARPSFSKVRLDNSLNSNMKSTSLEENKNIIQINVTDSSPDTTTLNTCKNSLNTSSKRIVGIKNINDGKLKPSNSNNLLIPSNLQSNNMGPGGHYQRRESFLYKYDDSENFVKLPAIRSASIASTSELHQDELIVTPFAQVLASLKTVRQNFEKINNAPKDKNNKNQLVNSIAININENLSILDDDSTKLMKDTLDEIDWCLMQLERMQSFKSISDSATTKFRLLLNKELTQYGGTDQIKQFISETYLDQKEEIESRNNEGPMRQSGPHRSDSSINLNRNLDETQTDDLCNNTSRHNERLKSIDETNCKNSQKNRIYWKNIPQKSFDKCETVNESVELNPSIKKENRTPSNDSAKNAQIISANKRRSLIPSSDRILSSQLESIKKPINDINNPSNSTMNSIFLTRISNSLQKENIIDEQTGEYYTYGVKTSKPKELDDLMEDLDVWGLDIFLMDELTEHRPLTAVAFTIFKQRDLMNTFSICPSTLINYLIELEDHYQSVPYHCKIHAADVTQSMHVLLNHKALESVFDDDEIFAAIFSAAIHDVDHPGLTNQYLISTASELAIMYNDDSVLENHHLAVAFKLLQHEKRDIFCNIPKKKRQLIRTMVIDMVRATDMSKHMSLLAELKTMVETKKVAGSGIIELDSYQDRIRVLKNMLHCADLSNPTKPLDIYRKWTDRVMNEFFLQGDKESSQGLEISAMCDRHKACIEKTQVGFIDFIVHPLWESWADLVHPDAQDILESLQRNRDWYSEQVENLQVLDKTNDKAQN